MRKSCLRTMLFAFVVLWMSAVSFGQVAVMVTIAPPPLPIYEQPICPGDGYLWTPGYWAWDDSFDDYYWVPGTWVLAPEVGFLWTPPYWGWGGEGFIFHEGFWGPQIGFYGGIDYGFGYFGVGYEGGRWENGRFFYNRAVTNVNVTEIHNVYNTTVVNRNSSHVSFNGGNGGIDARPTPEQEAAEHDRHMGPIEAQTQHRQQARQEPQLRASENRGKPPIAATDKPSDFKGHGVVQAREAGGTYNPPARRGGNEARTENRPENNAENRAENNRPENNGAKPGTPGHVRDLPPMEKPAAPNTGNAKLDKKYQQEQEKQYAKQNQERQKLAAKQEKEDQKVAKQNNEARKQQVEQQHQKETQQLQQRHEEQQHQMQQRMQPARPETRKPPR
jgi:WXXGXW repeat (2 copies)